MTSSGDALFCGNCRGPSPSARPPKARVTPLGMQLIDDAAQCIDTVGAKLVRQQSMQLSQRLLPRPPIIGDARHDRIVQSLGPFRRSSGFPCRPALRGPLATRPFGAVPAVKFALADRERPAAQLRQQDRITATSLERWT